jgi:phosphatidylinositol alpha-mannosyltransferase
MKIGFVYDDSLDRPDGVTQYVLRVGEWLSAQGHEVHYLVGQTERTDIPYIHSLSRNFKVRFNGNRLTVPLPASGKKIKALLGHEQFDVLHVQVPYSPLMAGKVIKAAPATTAVVGTFHIAPHSGLVSLATRLLALWSRSSLKRFDHLVSVSSAASEFAQKTYGVATPVLPNVVDYQHFAAGKPLAKYNDDTLTILFLGRLVARKGCLTLLQAIAQLQSRSVKLPSYRVVVCGGGPLQAQLTEYVRANSLQDIVEFAGRISEEDKPHYYASADIAAFPSSGGESFGIVLIEAMANGRTAVLGGDNPGYHTVLGANPDLLFTPTNATELADKLEQLLTSDAARTAAAAWGKHEAEQYDVQRVGQKLVDMYKQFAPNSRNG